MPNFNEVSAKKINTISSLEVAEMLGKKHKYIIREIEGSKDGKTVGVMPVLLGANFALSDYFIESTYRDSSGKSNKCYDCTKMGCELLGNKQQGEKGILFTAKYVKRFNEMEDVIKKEIKLTHVSEAIQLINITRELMKEQGCAAYEIALAVKQICDQFNISLPDCVVKPKTTLKDVFDMIDYICDRPGGTARYEDFIINQTTTVRRLGNER